MATGLQAFTNHEFGTIRTITSGGQILFCGKDVATALGYANTKDALARLVSSKLPAARQFEAWVFDDVLPSICRHGMYAIDELLADDEFLEQVIVTLRAERAKRLAATSPIGSSHCTGRRIRPRALPW